MKPGTVAWLCGLALLPHSNAESSATTTTSKNSPLTTWTVQRDFPQAVFDSYYREPSLEQQVSLVTNLASSILEQLIVVATTHRTR